MGAAHGFSITPGYGHASKLGRSSVAEAAGWTPFVVLGLPVRNLPAFVEQGGEIAHPQALAAETPVKAPHMRVLRRLAPPDVA